MHDRLSIGPRISIRGATGSGKTTLGHTLGQRLGLPVVELDAIYWLPNWQVKPWDQFRIDVRAALDACPHGWLCVGNYRHVQDLVLPITSRKTYVETTLRVLGTTPHHATVIELRSARAVRRLLQGLSHSKPTVPET